MTNMGVASSVLIIIAALLFIESLLVLLFPKKTVSIVKSMLKDPKKARRAGFIELAVVVILVLIAINI